MANQSLRVLLVAEHASAQFGGEAALPLHYFRILRRRGVDVWMIVHERTRLELEAIFPDAGDRIAYVPDTKFHVWAYHLGKLLPAKVEYLTLGFASRLLSQLIQRHLIRKAIQAHQITVIHQSIPVSPKEPSMIFGMGVPVVIGPMNGGMEYPDAFSRMENRFTEIFIALGRKFANFLNWLMPGKRRAEVLLVANQRTCKALPAGVTGKVIELVENGVDLSMWQVTEKQVQMESGKFETIRRFSPQGKFLSFLSNVVVRRQQTEQRLAATAVYSKYRRYLPVTAHLDQLLQTPSSLAAPAAPPTRNLTFVYVGRLVEWKAVDYLLLAFKQVADVLPVNLEIIGDGVMRPALEQQAEALGLLAGPAATEGETAAGPVKFVGWLAQADCARRLQHADAMVLPSVYECGGAVVLEAMAMGIPVIATNWGGPADYLDASCGILVDPESPEAFVKGLAAAIYRLASSAQLRHRMGQAGAERVRQQFDWDAKVDRMLEIYALAMNPMAEAASEPVSNLAPIAPQV